MHDVQASPHLNSRLSVIQSVCLFVCVCVCIFVSACLFECVYRCFYLCCSISDDAIPLIFCLSSLYPVCVLDVQEYLKLWMRANPKLVSALGDMSERGPFMAERPQT